MYSFTSKFHQLRISTLQRYTVQQYGIQQMKFIQPAILLPAATRTWTLMKQQQQYKWFATSTTPPSTPPPPPRSTTSASAGSAALGASGIGAAAGRTTPFTLQELHNEVMALRDEIEDRFKKTDKRLAMVATSAIAYSLLAMFLFAAIAITFGLVPHVPTLHVIVADYQAAEKLRQQLAQRQITDDRTTAIGTPQTENIPAGDSNREKEGARTSSGFFGGRKSSTQTS